MSKLISLLFLFVLSCLAFAQEVVFEHYQSGTEIWVLIPYNSLSFKRGMDYVDYQLSMEVKGSKKKNKDSFFQKLRIPKRDWLQDTAIPVRFTSSLAVDSYKLSLQLRNLNLGDKIKLNKSFHLGEYTKIGQAWLLAQKENQSFLPSSLEALGHSLESCEIAQKFSLEIDSLSIQMDEELKTYHPSQQQISVNLLNEDPLPKQITITLYEGNIRYEMHPFMYSPWFAYNLRYSYQDQIQQLRYIANQNQYRSLSALKGEELAQGIELFWQSLDPSPGTLRNEAREEFCNRVIEADERYTMHKKMKGWASDRGRIYIKYGEPDDINSEILPLGNHPTIVWNYYRENKEFIFQDLGGYGQYTLRNKDEELY